MNISDNIKWILDSDKWKLYSNRKYRAKIQKGIADRIYNVLDSPEIVYNFLEDSYEKVIPVDTKFTLEVDYGEKAVLKGNRDGIAHGNGDFILIETILKDGIYFPDFNQSGRVVNGEIFDKLYKEASGVTKE